MRKDDPAFNPELSHYECGCGEVFQGENQLQDYESHVSKVHSARPAKLAVVKDAEAEAAD